MKDYRFEGEAGAVNFADLFGELSVGFQTVNSIAVKSAGLRDARP